MASTRILKPINILAASHPVPPGNPMTPKQRVTYSITLKPDASGGGFYPYMLGTAQEAGDGPLDIYIFCDTIITFVLDTSDRSDWEFDPVNGITLHDDQLPGDRYHNFNPIRDPKTGRYVSATLDATYFKGLNKLNHDGYNLAFNIYAPPGGVPYPSPISLGIDPDIKNPGDYSLTAASP